ncbi:ATP-binding protein [Sinorhizobium meliloti]|uniref:ATP-binding protein n=1 Tax=Rhizobium meliloti TaxID=382 RepID=UPI001F16F1D1|nr:ATP-binding protein [Sinorhizobium meliloti]
MSSLHFDVSTGLKRVIGRDLITDDEVAIFELVKNSFDAGATKVQIVFAEGKIWIVDDGKGMSRNDIEKKWLFVAYSSKREKTRDSFRAQIGERRHFAGSKGIGRFSSDRLGSTLELQSRPADSSSPSVHRLSINWDDFEADDLEQFSDVALDYSELNGFNLLDEIERLPQKELSDFSQL